MMMIRLGDPGELALFLSIGGLFLGLFFGPIGQAIGRRIAGGKQKPDLATGLTTGEMTAERMAALEERVMELESERGQLEERLDFAERLLAQSPPGLKEVGPGDQR
jgi:hypothetical protein